TGRWLGLKYAEGVPQIAADMAHHFGSCEPTPNWPSIWRQAGDPIKDRVSSSWIKQGRHARLSIQRSLGKKPLRKIQTLLRLCDFLLEPLNCVLEFLDPRGNVRSR